MSAVMQVIQYIVIRMDYGETCLQVAYCRVKSSLELLNARVRVESLVEMSSKIESIYNEHY